jgi:hypothetical protein
MARQLLLWCQALPISLRKNMKTIDRINMYDLATAFISFGMVLGFAFR